MFQYQIYGMNISSSRKINLLDESEFTKADLMVDWKISDSTTPDNTFDWTQVSSKLLDQLTDVELWKAENENGSFTKICFKLKEIKSLSFVFDSKVENLRIFHHEEMLESDLESHFVGPVLSFIMRLRGIVCLHSSVVGFDGRAIAFLGHATAGKSTIAAGMAQAGAEILADDIAALIPQDEGFLVQSGYSKVRLRPKAAAFLTEDPKELPMVYSYRESRYVSLENNGKFHQKPLPLAAIYILGEFSDKYLKPAIEAVEAKDKLIKLLENTSGSYVISGNLRANEFKVLSEIAKTVPMRKLLYAHEISTLLEQCKLIIEDLKIIFKKQ